MNTEKMREEFEQWYADNFGGLSSVFRNLRVGNEYPQESMVLVNIAWQAWQAATPVGEGEPGVSARVEALTSDLSARINRVSRRSLDGNVVMSSEEWNGIIKLVEELLTAAHRKGEETHNG